MVARALAVDLGSSSVRAMVFESDGPGHLKAVPGAMARRLRHLETSQRGQASFAADSYLADLCACLDDLQRAGLLEGVSEVALDSQWHSVVAVGPDGCPLSDVISWADTRATREARRGLAPAPTGAGLEDLRQRTGCAFAPMYWTWRLPWLAATAEGLPLATMFLGLAEYIGLHLLGDPTMSVSMASGTGLLATSGHQWDPEAVELAATGAQALPSIAPQGWRGNLKPEHARRWPSLAAAAWHEALGDGAAANLGVGCDTPGRAALTIGTSAAVRAVRPGQGPGVLPSGLWRYCIDRSRVVLGSAYSSGGQLYSWALSLWEGAPIGATGTAGGAASSAGAVSHEVRYDISPPVPAGSQGVLLLPWHAGTRPPERAVPAGQGAVVGLGLGHSGAHIVSAAVEAVCFQLAGGLRQLEAGVGQELAVVVNGGAVERSPWWQQRLASTLGRAISVTAAPETTARGAAANALGVDLAAGSPDGHDVQPKAADVGALAEARARWEVLYGALPEVFARSG